MKHKCGGHWECFDRNGGTYQICHKVNPQTGNCRDSTELCPYSERGVRYIPDPDEGKTPPYLRLKASKGGKRSHGLE